MMAIDVKSSKKAHNFAECGGFLVLLGGWFCTIAFFFSRGWTDVF
jgi:hypothetical protein